MIQFSLFPRIGYALIAFGELLVGRDGRPSVKPTRRAAKNLFRRSAVGESAWLWGRTSVVPVSVHGDDEETPTYIIDGARAIPIPPKR